MLRVRYRVPVLLIVVFLRGGVHPGPESHPLQLRVKRGGMLSVFTGVAQEDPEALGRSSIATGVRFGRRSLLRRAVLEPLGARSPVWREPGRGDRRAPEEQWLLQRLRGGKKSLTTRELVDRAEGIEVCASLPESKLVGF